MSEILKYAVKLTAVGSRVTCNPPPTDTDEDFLVLVGEIDFPDFCACLEETEWELGGSEIVRAGCDDKDIVTAYGFNSWRKGNINFIVTTSEEFFDKFMEATAEAKARNLLKKEERIALFQKILYGNYTTDSHQEALT